MTLARRITLAMASTGLIVTVATDGAAQTEALIAVGAGGTTTIRAHESSSEWSIPIFRIPRPEGISFDWDVGATETSELHRWQFLFGPAYDIRAGRTETIASIVVGPSFNRSLNDGVTAKNSWAIQPQLTCWIDLNEWLGVKFSAGYTFTRASTTLASGPVGPRVDDSRLRLQSGVVVRVFPW